MNRLHRFLLGASLAVSVSAATTPSRAGDDDTRHATLGQVRGEHVDSGWFVRAGVGFESNDGGFGCAVEAWRSTRDRGMGTPCALRLLVGSDLRFGLGLGLDLVHYDRIDEDAGFGLLAPLAVAELGLRLGEGLRVSVEAQPQYRWHSFGQAKDQGRVAFGLGLTWRSAGD